VDFRPKIVFARLKHVQKQLADELDEKTKLAELQQRNFLVTL